MFPPGDGDPSAALQRQNTQMPQRRRMMGAGPGMMGGARPPMRPPGQMGQMGGQMGQFGGGLTPRGPMPGMGAPQGLGGQVPPMPMQARDQGMAQAQEMMRQKMEQARAPRQIDPGMPIYGGGF